MKNRTLPIAHSIALYRVIDRILFVKTEDEEGGPVERELPFNVRYKLQRDQGMLLRDYAFYENERNRLIDRFGTEKDGMMVVGDDSNEEFRKELLKIARMEVEHPLRGLTPEEMDSIKGDIPVSGSEMSLFIIHMVDDPEFMDDLGTPVPSGSQDEQGEDGSDGPEEKSVTDSKE